MYKAHIMETHLRRQALEELHCLGSLAQSHVATWEPQPSEAKGGATTMEGLWNIEHPRSNHIS